MTCIVTAGPTYEPLDQVRRLTNFSTGQLGSELAAYLAAQGHSVVLLRGYYSLYPPPAQVEVSPFTTTEDLLQKLRALGHKSADAVFHAAAVSDFRFGRVFSQAGSGALTELREGKVSTRSGTLLAELLPTPKIIGQLRDYFPRAWLVGWKYEVDGSRTTALEKGQEQIRTSRTNACVVNGPAYGPGFGIVRTVGETVACSDSASLFESLIRIWKCV